MSSGALPPTMSVYEADTWRELEAFWDKKAHPRQLPPKVKHAVDATGSKVRGATTATATFISDTPRSRSRTPGTRWPTQP